MFVYSEQYLSAGCCVLLFQIVHVLQADVLWSMGHTGIKVCSRLFLKGELFMDIVSNLSKLIRLYFMIKQRCLI